MSWRYAAASVRGSSHIKAGVRLQDAQACFQVRNGNGGRTLAAIVADGAGSAACGGEGAALVCRTLAVSAREAMRDRSALPDEDEVWSWVDLARDRIRAAAGRRRLTARDFAATLVLFIATDAEVLTVHIGDGAVVGRERTTATWAALSPPHHGEYAATTYFLTDEPQPALRLTRHANTFDALAVFSDGIENLVLDSATKQPSAAFFNPMARPLEAAEGAGRDRALSTSLAAFLAGERVCALTDDDKTLIVAVAR
ncbi:PP2C family serine/threonine-protein phosphatase [uncultured Enterovirga sp.]|uniref:PP2C family serine/threonine-protein phosphatase n=1 Tax=uncultured Enterovirga sp. TaxID=2026352 RepID=UPI0035CC9CA0